MPVESRPVACRLLFLDAMNLGSLRHIDWLKTASEDVQRQIPQLGDSSFFVCRRLAELLLKSLSRGQARRLLHLLPSDSRLKIAESRDFRHPARNPTGRAPKITYRQFRERALEALALNQQSDFSDKSDAEIEAVSHEITDLFFSVLGRTLPEQDLARIHEELPEELSRMLRKAA